MSETPSTETPAAENPATDGSTRTEQFTVSGEKLLAKVRELISEGNVRRIILRKDDGSSLLEIPLTAGLAGLAGLAVFAPVLVAVGAIAALLTSVSVTVVRDAPAADAPVDDIVDAEVVDEHQI